MMRTRMLPIALLVGLVAGCGGGKTPSVPHAAYTMRSHERIAFVGNDTTRATLSYPYFVSAATAEALDSLNAITRALALAAQGPLEGSEPDSSALLDGFIESWRESQRHGFRAPWFFERRIVVAGDTLGVVTLRMRESVYSGGAHPNTNTLLTLVAARSGRTLRFADLFRESARDSMSATLEPDFRALWKLAPDSSLKEAGFWFEDGRFHVNDNVGVGSAGVTFYFNPYEIAPYSTGPTNLVVPFDKVRPFANPNGPLAAGRAR